MVYLKLLRLHSFVYGSCNESSKINMCDTNHVKTVSNLLNDSRPNELLFSQRYICKFRENPEMVQNEFYNFRDKVATCVSFYDIEKKATIMNQKEEWFNYNKNLLTSCLDHSITNLYAEIDIQNKLANLHDLEKETEEIAWRPQTGKPDLSSIEGNHLDKKKKYLTNSILHIRKKTSLLQSEISDFRSGIEQQINETQEYTSRSDQENDETEMILTNN